MPEEKKPRFSVLMANYNKSKYIGSAIESVLRQSFFDWELIIIDDGSNDESEKIISYYLGVDNRIRFIRHQDNRGTVISQKDLVDAASADIVGILDSDDVLHNDAINQVMLVFDNRPDVGFVYTKLMLCNEKLEEVSEGSNAEIPEGETVLRFDRVCAFRTFRRSSYYLTPGYDEEIQYAEDADIVIKLEEVTKLFFINKVLYYYRISKDSQFQDKDKRKVNSISHTLAKYGAFLRRQNTNLPNLTKKEMSDEIYRSLPLCLETKRYGLLFRLFYYAFIIYPINFSSWKYLLKKFL